MFAKRATVAVAGFVLALAILGFGYRSYRLHQIAQAVETPNGISEGSFVQIGGIDQWVTIRGQNRDNPVLLLVHGGPGNAFQSLSLRTFLDWEKEFTLVQWDQRGAGKTYAKSGPVGADVTIERMVSDGIEVADHARRTLGKTKLILVGLSWGSMLGVRMVAARPDLFHAYVGTGQSVSYRKGQAQAYVQLLDKARVRGDRQAIQELEDIGPPPHDSTAKAFVHTRWANRYEPGMPSNWSAAATVLFDSPVGVSDLRNLMAGIRTSEDHFRREIEAGDLLAFGTDFAIPMFFFQGADDNVAPTALVQAYVERIAAPQKRLFLIPNAGHNAIATRSTEFLGLLRDWVRPLAQ